MQQETKVYYESGQPQNIQSYGQGYPHPQNPPPYAPAPGPQPGVYQPGPYQPGSSTTITVQPGMPMPMIVGPTMGSRPTNVVCRSCNVEIVTRVEFKPTLRTHMFALLLCIFGCWPCVCLPYCMESCRNIDHYCPNCNAYVGTYINM